VGIAFSQPDGSPDDIFEVFWPALLARLSSHSTVKILPEAAAFRTLGYVRRTMLCSGTVLFDRGLPSLAFSDHLPFAMICHEEFRRLGGYASDDFYRDPLEPWGAEELEQLEELDSPPPPPPPDPDDIPY
jgi:hypothetical protein